MQGRRWGVPALGSALAWVVALGLGPGCDVPERADEVALLATLDTHHFCDMDAVVEVRLRAHWQACAADEQGCEPPPATVVDGDRYTCPATDATHELGVALTHPGRYRVEAVAVLTTLQEQPECFVDPSTGGTRIELGRQRLEEAPVVLDEHGPCPP